MQRQLSRGSKQEWYPTHPFTQGPLVWPITWHTLRMLFVCFFFFFRFSSLVMWGAGSKVKVENGGFHAVYIEVIGLSQTFHLPNPLLSQQMPSFFLYLPECLCKGGLFSLIAAESITSLQPPRASRVPLPPLLEASPSQDLLPVQASRILSITSVWKILISGDPDLAD